MPERQRLKQKTNFFLTRSAALFAAFGNSREPSFFGCVAAFPRRGNLRTHAPAERPWLPAKQGPDDPEKQTAQPVGLPRKCPFQATLEAASGSDSTCGGRRLPTGRGDAGRTVCARGGAGGPVALGCVRRAPKARCGMRNCSVSFDEKNSGKIATLKICHLSLLAHICNKTFTERHTFLHPLARRPNRTAMRRGVSQQ